MRTRPEILLSALLFVLFFLPWIERPQDEGQGLALSGYAVLVASFNGVSESYDAAVARLEAAASERAAALVKARERAEEAARRAEQARAFALDKPDDKRAKRDAERRARSAERAAEAVTARQRENEIAEQQSQHLWLHYLLYLYPLVVLLVPVGAAGGLLRGLAGRPGRAPALTAALALIAVFLAGHVWFGVASLGWVAWSGWLSLFAALVLVPLAGGVEPVTKTIDRLNYLVGRGVAWLALFMVLVQFALVIMRYVFGVGSIMVQESLIYAHGTLFMVAAGYTLLVGGHVRVDIFYREAPPRIKALVDILGVVFLLTPVCLLIWLYSLPYVTNSWAVFEGSRETSGIPGIFLLKTTMLLFVALVLLQGISMALRSWLVLIGLREDAGIASGGGH